MNAKSLLVARGKKALQSELKVPFCPQAHHLVFMIL